ncbi:MAG TPA: D-aminoacyl-tRNA deacylase [Alcanivoracaceae bacterium]|nr:D-aminoacyl-tRNA deacylase [Alcanivoracaceae bacterium]
MKVLLQRVSAAHVEVNEETIGQIGHGLLLLVGICKGDTPATVEKLAQKVLGYRVFEDEQGKMNLNVQQAGGGLLIVSQFTLSADTDKGLRPSFSSSAPPAEAQRLYEYFVQCCTAAGVPVATGQFGADMQVHLVNDGPVTFLLEAN